MSLENLPYGTPDGIDADELKELQAIEDEIIKPPPPVEEEKKPQQSSPQQTETKKPEAEQPQQVEEQLEKDLDDGYYGERQNEQQPGEEGADFGDYARTYGEMAAAVPTSLLDFGVDLINVIPGVEFKKLPKFENDVIQATRDISSVILPTIGLTMAGQAGVAKATAAPRLAKLKPFLVDPFVKWLGNASLGAGTGALVDQVSEQSEGDNASGMLKKTWPRAFGWIPDSVATLDSDSPDVKRQKNVTEGVGLGAFTDVLAGLGKLSGAAYRSFRASRWIPETEKAKNWFAKNGTEAASDASSLEKAKEEYINSELEFAAEVRKDPTFEEDGQIKSLNPEDYTEEKVRAKAERDWNKFSDKQKQEYAGISDVQDTVASSAAKRSESLDELGAYGFTKSQNLDEPILGVHDMYGYGESGVRSVDDMGIIGASVDQARIAKNIDTSYGRLGSVMSEPALKYSLEGVEEYTGVMKGLRDALSDAGEYGYRLNSGKVINSVTIRESAEQLAKDMGYMTKGELEAQLKKFQTGIDADTGLPSMSSEGVVAVKLAIRDAMKEFADPASQALIRTSMAGQVSDMAMAARYAEGTPAMIRSEEQILDRLEMLMIANGEAGKQRGFALNIMNVFKRGGRPPTAAELRKRGADTLAQLQAEAKEVRMSLEGVRKERPEFLGPLLLAYEATDGNVRSMDLLNNYWRNSTGILRKAFIDGNPEIPSLVMKGFWSNVYNSTLSAFATPLKAGLANAALLVQRPIASMAGALAHGDITALRRGFYQYWALTDTIQKGMKYMGETMRRSGVDPTYAGVAGRDDLIRNNEKQIEVIKAYADAAAENGEYGPQAMVQQIEAIQDLADHPWMRFGTRAMQALDGFTQAVIANVEARGEAFDLFNMGKIDADTMQSTADAYYKKMWTKDSKGREIITDKAVKQISGEIAMNLDSKFSTGLSSAINRVPALRPFLLFTKTPVNMLQFAASHNPVGLFINEVNAFSKPFDEMPLTRVQELLEKRGIPMDEFAPQKYAAIRNELKGRKAIGTLAVSSTVGLFLAGNITGNGMYDRQKQRTRRDADWKPRSIRLPGGKWVSYDNLGAITDWIALTADIMDNMDVLDEGTMAEKLHAMGFVLSASITDKTMLAGLEPMYDMLTGNPAAINRWASSFLPAATMPGASQMAELGRLLSPNMRVVEEDLYSMLANRTPLKSTLPDQYDWIDGDKINDYQMTPEGVIARLWNTYSPWKVNGKVSEEKQFLMDIEYDGRPSMKTDDRGTKLTINEQAEVYRIMGKNGLFKREIRRIMNSTDGKEFRRKFKAWREAGREPQLKDFDLIHSQLDSALNIAKEVAILEIDANNDYSISERRAEDALRTRQSQMGDIQEILQIR